MSTTLASEIELGLETHFDNSAIDTGYPCVGCDGSGGVEWDDHVVGPCPACQSETPV